MNLVRYAYCSAWYLTFRRVGLIWIVRVDVIRERLANENEVLALTTETKSRTARSKSSFSTPGGRLLGIGRAGG